MLEKSFCKILDNLVAWHPPQKTIQKIQKNLIFAKRRLEKTPKFWRDEDLLKTLDIPSCSGALTSSTSPLRMQTSRQRMRRKINWEDEIFKKRAEYSAQNIVERHEKILNIWAKDKKLNWVWTLALTQWERKEHFIWRIFISATRISSESEYFVPGQNYNHFWLSSPFLA